jgi:hypothetical protein
LLEEDVEMGTDVGYYGYYSCSAGAGKTVAVAVAGTAAPMGPEACTELEE